MVGASDGEPGAFKVINRSKPENEPSRTAPIRPSGKW